MQKLILTWELVSCAVLFLWCLLNPVAIAKQCLVAGNNGESPPVFMNYPSDELRRITRHNQAIIASYKFRCCGNVTEWGVDVRPDGGMDDMGEYTLDLQVWRPSPTVNDSTGAGEYSLVGKNIFPSITLMNRVASLTPLPRDYIQFQSGDVLGFYVAEARQSGAGLPLLSTGSFSSYSVWHASVGSQYTATMISAGTNGELSELTSAAPVVTVSTTTYDCPSILSSHVLSPSLSSTSPSTGGYVSTSAYSTSRGSLLQVLPATPFAESEYSTTTIRESLFNDILDGSNSVISYSCSRMPNSTVLTDCFNSTTYSEDDARNGLKNKIISYTIIGCVSFIVVIALICIIICLRLKVKRLKKGNVSLTTNGAYGARLKNNADHNYTYPRLDPRNIQNPMIVHIDMDPTYNIEMIRNDSYLKLHRGEGSQLGRATELDIIPEVDVANTDTVTETTNGQTDNITLSYDYIRYESSEL